MPVAAADLERGRYLHGVSVGSVGSAGVRHLHPSRTRCGRGHQEDMYEVELDNFSGLEWFPDDCT